MIGMSTISIGGEALHLHTGRFLSITELSLSDGFDVDEDRVRGVERLRDCRPERRHRDAVAAYHHHNFVRRLRRHLDKSGDVVAQFACSPQRQSRILGGGLFFEIIDVVDAMTEEARSLALSRVSESVSFRAPQDAAHSEVAAAVEIIIQCATTVML